MNDVKSVMEHSKSAMEKALSHLETQLTKIRAGKANPAIFESVMVDYYLGEIISYLNLLLFVNGFCIRYERIIIIFYILRFSFPRIFSDFGKFAHRG